MKAGNALTHLFLCVVLFVTLSGLLLAYPSPGVSSSALLIGPQCPGGKPPPCATPTSTPKKKPPPRKRNRPVLPRTRTNQAGIEFVLIPPGSFMMGSTNGFADEQRVHWVTIKYSFYMGKYEVTQAEWQQVMGNNPSFHKGERLPVETVSWNDAQEFIRKLNAANDGYHYGLPTEAEWEYASRAGTTTNYYWGDDVNQACRYANVIDQTNQDKYKVSSGIVAECRDGYAETSPVGSFQPNAWGLYDVAGNVLEWCKDWYHPNYDNAPIDGSAWLSGGEQKYRVRRGGFWGGSAIYLRSANRWEERPDVQFQLNGFRVVAVRISAGVPK